MIKAVHIAPPTDKLYGDYLLSSHDWIINTLRKLLPVSNGVPKYNYDYTPLDVRIPDEEIRLLSKNFGHSFTDIYLNPKLKIAKKTLKLIDDALDNLKCSN